MLVDVFKADRRKIVDGIPYLYDGTRSKWLSEQEFQALFRTIRRNITGERWVWFDNRPSNRSGFKFVRNSTIKTVDVFLGNSATCEFKFYKNGGEVLSVTLTGEAAKSVGSLDIDVADGDDLSCKIISSQLIDNIDIYLSYSFLTT